jgi:hypothetical protein
MAVYGSLNTKPLLPISNLNAVASEILPLKLIPLAAVC